MENTEQKFTVPNHITVQKTLDANDFREVNREEAEWESDYVAVNSRSGRVYAVDESSYLLLSTLSDASLTPRALVEEIAAYTNGSPSEVREVVFSVLERIQEQGLVLPTKTAESVSADVGFEPGDTVGPYRIEEILHHRTWRTVVRAQLKGDPSVNEANVLLKLLRLPSSASEEACRSRNGRFEKEFECMAAVADHPNVCSLYHVEIAGDVSSSPSYAAIEYIDDGVFVREMIEEEGYDHATRFDIAGQVLGVMAHLHDEGLLHGDIHARNFVVDADSTVNLVDFGRAKRRDLKKNEVVPKGGAAHYIPPERIRDDTFEVSEQDGTPRAEVFQVGVLLYGLFRGELPFQAPVWEDLVQAIREEEPAPLTETPTGTSIPDPVKRIVERALSKDPDDRYASAIDMREDWTRRVGVEA